MSEKDKKFQQGQATARIGSFRESDRQRPEPIPLEVHINELRRHNSVDANRPPPAREPAGAPASILARAGDSSELIHDSLASLSKDLNELDPEILHVKVDILQQENNDLREELDQLKLAHPQRKTSDVLSDRLVEARRQIDQLDRDLRRAQNQNQELRGQVKQLTEALEQQANEIKNYLSRDSNTDPAALQKELEQSRRQSTAEIESLRHRLQEVASTKQSERDVELEAELQALRQQNDLLRSGMREKDHTLDDLANRFRNLEDHIEDRDREIDHLRQELDHQGGGILGVASRPNTTPVFAKGGTQPGSMDDKDTSDVLDASSLVYMGPAPRGPTNRTAILAGILISTLILAGGYWLFVNYSAAPPVLPMPMPPAASPALGATPIAAPQPAPAPAVEASAPSSQPAPDAGPATIRDNLRDGGKGPAMVRLVRGSFTMGGVSSAGMAQSDEQPIHTVELGTFYLSATEVTFEDYDRFARATGRSLPGDQGWGRGRQPVVNVSWDDARAYAAWLSSQTGAHYRLPSEAEWEYGARGGVDNRFWWGFQLGRNNAVCFGCGSKWDNRSPAPVASLAPNPFGLYDTAGNIMEWAEDCYHPDYQGAPANGSAWVDGECGSRVVRGGAFNKPPPSVRGSARLQLAKDSRLQNLGFRVARNP